MELDTDYKRFFPPKSNHKLSKSFSKLTEAMRDIDDYYILKGTNNITDESCDDEKLKQKDMKLDIADVLDSINESDKHLKLKRKRVENIIATQLNNDDKKATSFGKGVSSDVSDSMPRSLICPKTGNNVLGSSQISDASKNCSAGVKPGLMNDVGLGLSNVEVLRHDRRHDFALRMLRWVTNVAKNPTDPVIGMIPESSRWAFYGNDNCWKQVLLAREALFVKRDQIFSVNEFTLQVEATSGRPRSCPRPLPRKPSDESLFESTSSMATGPTAHETNANRGRRLEARLDLQPTASIYTNRPLHRIPIGEPFQAEVPEWTGVPAEADPKWLGTRVWPLEKRDQNFLIIETDPIGKGRPGSCTCQFPGSTDCVKFHVSQRRMKLTVELRSAFYAWKFDKMGEVCSVSWTVEEEKKFNAVFNNPMSAGECVWPQLHKFLPGKTRDEMVNFYFNVFVLRRRAWQNRYTPDNIDSDDETTDFRAALSMKRLI